MRPRLAAPLLVVAVCLLALFSTTNAATVVATYNSANDVPVSLAGYVATGNTVEFQLNFLPAIGSTLMVVKNTDLSFITGTFDNLVQGQIVELTFSGRIHRFVANYYGGTGNDLVLQWAGVRALSWGRNYSGQLGRGDTIDSKLPVAVTSSGVLNGKVILKLAAGSTHALALCSDGTLAAWGSNDSGQLGDGTTTNRSDPVAVDQTGVLSGKTVVSIAAGESFSLALCSDGTVVSWGFNGYGQLGNGTTVSSSVPVAVNTSGDLSGKTVSSISAGGNHSVAVCTDGSMVAWGRNGNGQLGVGNTSNTSVPRPVYTHITLAGKSVIHAAAGDIHTLALCSDGTMAAWGWNAVGCLGIGNTADVAAPAPVITTGTLAGKTITGIAAGKNHSMALCSDGSIAAWGGGSYGQLGNGSTSAFETQPRPVSGSGGLSGNPPLSISAGHYDSLAVLSDGTVAAWGLNVYGQLGDGSATARLLPVSGADGAKLPDERLVSATTAPLANFSLALAAYPSGARMIVETQGHPKILADEDSAEIGKTAVGASPNRTFVVRNPGDAALTGLTVSLRGTDVGEFALGALSAVDVAPGASASFTVTFFPSGRVLRTASILISANPASFAGTHDIHINGLGLTESEAWRLEYFQTIENTGAAADSATPRDDGITNLMKFATGMNPAVSGTNPGSLSRSGNTYVFVYRRAKVAVADGIAFNVEWSDNLGATPWSGTGVSETVEDQGETELVTATVPSGTASARFVHLRVDKP